VVALGAGQASGRVATASNAESHLRTWRGSFYRRLAGRLEGAGRLLAREVLVHGFRFLAVMSVAGVSSIGAGNRRRCCQQQCSYQWQRRCQWQRTSASHFMATMSPSVLGRSRLVTCATRRPAGLCRDRQVLECARALRGQVRQAPRLSRSPSEAGRWACVASCRRRQVGQEAPPTATRWKPRRQRVTRAQQACGKSLVSNLVADGISGSEVRPPARA
jgi:hypothetical protein